MQLLLERHYLCPGSTVFHIYHIVISNLKMAHSGDILYICGFTFLVLIL